MADQEQISGSIRALAKDTPFAFAFSTKWSSPKVTYSAGRSVQGTPHDPVVDVIQEICQGHPYRPDFHLLYSDASLLSLRAKGMLRFIGNSYGPLVVTPADNPAKPNNALKQAEPRHQGLETFMDFETGVDPGLDLGSGEAIYHTADRLYMMAAYALTAHRANDSPNSKDYNIGAILVSRSGQILAWGLNTSSANMTAHAEVNTLQSYRRRTGQEIPNRSRLYTTLKPCCMCAGMIADCMPGAFRVIYAQDDPGEHARGTVLDLNRPEFQIHLGEKDTKALKTYKSQDFPSETVDNNLAATFEAEKKAYLVTFLAKKDVVSRMESAGLGLQRKSIKYANSPDLKNPVVLKVLIHLAPFLRSLGLPLIDEKAFAEVDFDLLENIYRDVKATITAANEAGLDVNEKYIPDVNEKYIPEVDQSVPEQLTKKMKIG